jgi:hypothetical protein
LYKGIIVISGDDGLGLQVSAKTTDADSMQQHAGG